MKRTPVYLDNAATTPLDPRVLDAMLPFLRDDFGNPSSVHAAGRRARGAVEAAREKVAEVIGAEPGEIIFTSGGTEADNHAIRGWADSYGVLVTSRVEHEAVLEPARRMGDLGKVVDYVPVRPDGTVAPVDLADALQSHRGADILVSLMHVNNEVGGVNDVASLAEVSRQARAVFHCDAVQSVGLIDIDVHDIGIDMLSLSAHKFHGPKGVGALYVGADVRLEGVIRGGKQERGRRAGTENVAGIVGLARALELSREERPFRLEHISTLRDRLRRGLAEIPGEELVLNSTAPDDRLAPHIVNVSVMPGEQGPMDGEMLLLNLDMEGVHLSSGSACTSGTVRPSHVLQAIGRGPELATASLRFSLGKDNTDADVDYAVECLARIIRRMRRS